MNKSNFTNSIFEQAWWLDVVAPDAWRDITVEEDGRTIARWPIVELNGDIQMPKMTQTLGFWIAEDILAKDIHFNRREKITNLLLDQLPQNSNVNISLNASVDYFLPLYWNGFKVSPHVSYRLNGLSDLDALYNRFSKGLKLNIKRAQKKFKIEASDDIEGLLVILDKTFARQKMLNPWSKQLIRNIYSACKSRDACKLLYAIGEDGEPASGSLAIYDANVCYGWLGGTDPEYRKDSPFSLVVWESIKFASTVSEKFDLMGSMIEGVEGFMRQFGGTPTVYYEIQKQKKSGSSIALAKFRTHAVAKLKSFIGFDNWFKLKSIFFKEL